MMFLMLAPITLFVYNRLNHTRQTVEALLRNELAAESEFFVFSDGPRSETDREKVLAVRSYLKTINSFKKVAVIERDKNFGLAESIIAGVTEIVNRYGRIIVLEDDMVTSPYFLKYMNDALEIYKDEEKVISIHGYIYPVRDKLPETFFLRGADCWGWATWKRGWDLFDPDGRKLLEQLQKRNLTRTFDFEIRCKGKTIPGQSGGMRRHF
jgi:GT2 family glycosyltransferase